MAVRVPIAYFSIDLMAAITVFSSAMTLMKKAGLFSSIDGAEGGFSWEIFLFLALHLSTSSSSTGWRESARGRFSGGKSASSHDGPLHTRIRPSLGAGAIARGLSDVGR
jgi:hypothetical protein